jgi:hypothetical protein
MSKKMWWKSALFALMTGATLGLAIMPDGCMGKMIQRVLIAVALD